MKALLSGKQIKRINCGGFSTLEILIAFAVLMLSISAVILVVFGNQSLAVDTQTNNDALSRAQAILESQRAISRQDFSKVVTVAPAIWAPVGGPSYSTSTTVSDITQCKKQATSTVSWQQGSRTLSVSLTTYLSDMIGFAALGGDCDVNPPTGGWTPPVLFARDTISPGKFNALDALQKIVYLGSDQTPNLFIADTRSAVLNSSSNQSLIIPQAHADYANHFNSSGTALNEVNDIDTFKDVSTAKVYAFLATASSTAQLIVVDVTDINNPIIPKNSLNILAKRTLSGVGGSFPEGWRIYYYNHRVYITTRETAGPEFHIFDVNDPTNPIELGAGKKLTGCTLPNGSTVNDLVVRDDIAYFAADKANCELMVYDVSVPAAPTYMAGASVNLPGVDNGESVYLIGNKLYFGRQKSSSGPELYIFDASNVRTVTTGLPMIGASDPNKEMNKDITGIQVAGRFAFLASYGDSSGGLKVWDIFDPANIRPVYLTFNFGNKLSTLDFDSNYLYAAGESTPNFQMLYSP